jgi:inorganic pyrophosphatase
VSLDGVLFEHLANVFRVNTTVSHSPERADGNQLNIPQGENKSPAPIDPSIDKWFYISGAPSS